jgi:uncharacterized protein (DUF58 family)
MKRQDDIKYGMQISDYTYSEQSRRPATLLALALSVAMLTFGWTHAAPWYFLAPVLLAFGMLLWMVIVNRKSGMSVTGENLHLFAGEWHQVVPTAQIRSVKVVAWSDGAPTITLSIEGSPNLSVPGYCFGSANDLIGALESRNIEIVESGRSLRR